MLGISNIRKSLRDVGGNIRLLIFNHNSREEVGQP